MTADLVLDIPALRRLCLPVGKPLIELNPDSMAMVSAGLTYREKQQIAAAWNALPLLLNRIEELERSLAAASRSPEGGDHHDG